MTAPPVGKRLAGPEPHEAIPLPSDEVHVWWSDLHGWKPGGWGLGPDGSHVGPLPPEDLARSRRFHFGIGAGPHGKPYLAHPPGSSISFSLARISGAALCAVRTAAVAGPGIEARISVRTPVQPCTEMIPAPGALAGRGHRC